MNDVFEKQNELEGQIKSNDSHIIALAIVAKAVKIGFQRQNI